GEGVIEAEEEVFGLDAPVVVEGIFDAAARNPEHAVFAAVRGQRAEAAAAGGAVIEERRLDFGEAGAALGVEQRAIDRKAEATRSDRVPIADPGVEMRVVVGVHAEGIDRVLRSQAEKAAFTFDAEDESRTGSLPVAAKRATGDPAATVDKAERTAVHNVR